MTTNWARYTPRELHDRVTYPELNELMRSASDFTADVGWTRREYKDEATGARCIAGLVLDCPITTWQPGDNHIVYSMLYHDGFGWPWNDQLSMQEGETAVRKLLWEMVIDDAALCTLFGPQWQEIIALVRRAALLTDEPVSKMPGQNYRFTASARATQAYAVWLGTDEEHFSLPAGDTLLRMRVHSESDSANPGIAAAAEAAVGIATRHLVGTAGYAEKDHRYLMSRWEKMLKSHPEPASDWSPIKA